MFAMIPAQNFTLSPFPRKMQIVKNKYLEFREA
jgi:hypothetical protein